MPVDSDAFQQRLPSPPYTRPMPAAMTAVLLLPLGFEPVEYKGKAPAKRCGALVIFVAILWATDAFPPHLVAMSVPLIAVVLQVMCVPRHLRLLSENDTLLVPGKGGLHTTHWLSTATDMLARACVNSELLQQHGPRPRNADACSVRRTAPRLVSPLRPVLIRRCGAPAVKQRWSASARSSTLSSCSS